MEKSPLIVISIAVTCLIVLSSYTNVVGVKTIEPSNRKVINDKVDQKDLLFQTIIDIANNNEIQSIILKSQISKEGLFNPDIRFSKLNTPVLTKNQLQRMYLVGLMLSKIIKKSKIHSMVEQYQLNNQGMQKEITDVIEKDATLNREIAQLSNSKCDCENQNITWNFPVVCLLLFPLWIIAVILAITSNYGFYFIETIANIGSKLHCFWNIVPSGNL